MTAADLTPILEFKSTWNDGEDTSSDRCHLVQPKPLRATLQPLDVNCESRVGHWHNDDPRQNGEDVKPSVVHYRWNGARYAKP